MGSITIEKQETRETLMAAFAMALSNELGEGWTVLEDGVTVVNSNGLGFVFNTWSSSSVAANACNLNGCVTAGSLGVVGWSASSTYVLDVYRGKNGGAAVGIRLDGDPRQLTCAIAENTLGETAALKIESNNVSFIHPNTTSARKLMLAVNNAGGIATSLVPLPDVWGGGIFKDLFVVLSCPVTNTDLNFFIDGRRFTQLKSGSNNSALALEIDS